MFYSLVFAEIDEFPQTKIYPVFAYDCHTDVVISCINKKCEIKVVLLRQSTSAITYGLKYVFLY